MSKTELLNNVIVTSSAMNSVCSELAKCISPQKSSRVHERSKDTKVSFTNIKLN